MASTLYVCILLDSPDPKTPQLVHFGWLVAFKASNPAHLIASTQYIRYRKKSISNISGKDQGVLTKYENAPTPRQI
jgi:hypothetical protein